MPRTRSASAHRKVLNAALELIGEHGVEATSMDAIAARSGVSKATIYKHWADKDALLLELMSTLAGLIRPGEFDSGDARADMTAVLSYRPADDNPTRQRTMPHFIAYTVHNQAFRDAWRKMVMEPQRRELTHQLKSGMAKGELAPELDLDLSLALLLGPMIYAHVVLNTKEEDRKRLAEKVVDAFWRAFGLGRATMQLPAWQPGRTKPVSGPRRPRRS